jgi:pyrroline-5-carboxylate reductase
VTWKEELVIALLGTGKLAEAIIRGALAAGALSREQILVTCRRAERAAELRALGLKVVPHSSDGLEPPVAFQIATQTVFGASALLAKSNRTLEQLIAEVAGKGGSTRAGLDVLEQGGLDSLLANAVKAAVARARERTAELQQTTNVTPAST